MFTFREIDEADAKMILDWRTSPRVAKYMETEFKNSLKEQQQWILYCRQQFNFYHWIIMYEELPIGYLSLNDYCPEGRTTSWGFYIGEEEHAGLGGLVPPFFYRFCFTELGIERIDAQMLHFNSSVIELHRLHGYQFTPERDHTINKNGTELLLISMSLQKSDFEAGKFFRFRANFPTSLWNRDRGFNESSNIVFEKITGSEEQILFLHQLLSGREHTISHKRLPDMATHREFVTNNPYREWWIVRFKNNVIGSVYLTKENAIGLNLTTSNPDMYVRIINKVKIAYRPLPEIPSVRPNYFFVNVAPENLTFLRGLKKMSAIHTQNSYRI